MRIVVVDDEREIRDYLAGMPQWAEAGCEVVGTAADGEEALGVIARLKPDVLVTDIRMPVMDGIELAEALRALDPDLPIVFLTAHHDFEYARQAIRLGVADFLTKPFLPEDLLRVVERLRGRRQTDWREHDAFFAMFGDERTSSAEKHAWLRERNRHDVPFVLFYAEPDQEHGSQYGRNPFARKQLRAAMEQLSRQLGFPAWISESSGGVNMLLPFEASSEDRWDVLAIARHIPACCDRESGISASVGISRRLASLLELPEAIRQAAVCMDYRMLLGSRSVLAFDAVEAIAGEKERESIASVNRLAEWLRSGETEGIRDTLAGAYRRMLSIGASRGDIQHFCLGVVERAEDAMLEFGIEPDRQEALDIRKLLLGSPILTEMMRALERYLLVGGERIRRLIEQSPKRLIAETLAIIEADFAEELSLQAVSKRLNVNYSYLSRLIKKETGQNFSDLLWAHRIEAAKVKLLHADVRAYEVALAVGFKDYPHFSQLFKKMTGLSPRDYVQQTRQIERTSSQFQIWKR